MSLPLLPLISQFGWLVVSLLLSLEWRVIGGRAVRRSDVVDLCVCVD